mmetsp:Transcript_8061/g.12258  ORF Transcript_8061/g.12258 Transcript_8061/m.12258 type:complete len:89 (+) Transcript_8061:2-268(+)
MESGVQGNQIGNGVQGTMQNNVQPPETTQPPQLNFSIPNISPLPNNSDHLQPTVGSSQSQSIETLPAPQPSNSSNTKQEQEDDSCCIQ